MDIFNLNLPEDNENEKFPLDAWFDMMNKQMERIEEVRHEGQLNSILFDNDINTK